MQWPSDDKQCRGINNETDPLELRFRTDHVNSVFAENGVRQSSIFEALRYAIRGKVSKLQDLQEQEEPESYLATTSPSGYAEPPALLKSLNKDFALLDYTTFQQFIDNTPLQRGRSFAAPTRLSRYRSFTRCISSVEDIRTLNSDLGISGIRFAVSAADEAIRNAHRRLTPAYEKLTGKQLEDTANLDVFTADIVGAPSGVPMLMKQVEGRSPAEIDFQQLQAWR
jgi:hypothetical protein